LEPKVHTKDELAEIGRKVVEQRRKNSDKKKGEGKLMRALLRKYKAGELGDVKLPE